MATEGRRVAPPSIPMSPALPQHFHATNRTFSSSSTLGEKSSSTNSIKSLPMADTKATEKVQDPTEVPEAPSVGLVKQLLLFFVGFIVALVFVSRFPTGPSWTVLLVIGTLFSAGLLLYCACRKFLDRHRHGEYKPNLGNTVAVVLLTIPIFTALYLYLWHPKLKHDYLVTTTDLVERAHFPSVALFQRKDWSSQANLRSSHGGDSGSKCFLGWHNETAVACSELPPDVLGDDTQCTCKELWYNNDQVIEEFEWMNTSYRYVAFNSPSWLTTGTPTYMLLLQTFFDYNVDKARKDSSTYNPTLMLAVYDPVLGMQKAFDQGYTRMRLINANGIVSINIGLRIRQSPNQAPAYDYNLDISTSQASMNPLVCDTSTVLTYLYACYVSLFITIPSFERTITTIQKEMSWTDVIASAGGYFSLVQTVSWIVSGLAWRG